MTEQEFDSEQTRLLIQLPEKFRVRVSRYCWEQGHSNGYSEVICYMEEMVYGLLQCLKDKG